MNQHPLADFRYCPHCGSTNFLIHTPYSKRCTDCGFEFFPNAAAATVAVILNERGELLTVKRQREPARGTLDLPGGFVDPGESITEGLRREVQEEIGGELLTCEFLCSQPDVYPYSGHTVHSADAFFRCTLRNAQQLIATDDAADIQWIALDQVQPEAFGLPSIQAGMKWIKEHLLKQEQA